MKSENKDFDDKKTPNEFNQEHDNFYDELNSILPSGSKYNPPQVKCN